MTNVFLHIKLVGVGLETRLGQDHFRTEGRSFKGDRCDIYIDFLDFMSQRVWKEDLSMSDQISTDNSLGWFDSALHLALQFVFVLFGLFLLGTRATRPHMEQLHSVHMIKSKCF